MAKILGTTAVMVSDFDGRKMLNKAVVDKIAKELGPLISVQLLLQFRGVAAPGGDPDYPDSIVLKIDGPSGLDQAAPKVEFSCTDPTRASKVFDVLLAAGK